MYRRNIITRSLTYNIRFHEDYSHSFLVNIFIYLNDVTINNGPHIFVKNSFKNMNDNLKKNLPGTRIENNIIEEIFKNDIIYHTYKTGTLIIEDTINLDFW